MKTLKSKLCIILSVLACLCFGIVALVQLTPATVNTSAAVEGYSTTDFKMLDKGSVRKDLAQNGLRFATFIGDDSAEAGYDFVNDYELGTLFLPKAAIEGDAQLTIEGTYKNGVQAVAAVFDGDLSKLTTDATYTGGKLFNAVIELTDFTNEAKAMNGEIVARTYVKNKTTNEVAYLDAVERSAAYVAALALGAEEDDAEGTLASYVQYIDVDAPSVINIGSWYALNKWGEGTALPTINVEGLEVEYSAETGLISTPQVYGGTPVPVDLIKIDGGKMYGLNEGDTRLVLSIANGAITKYVNVTISLPQVAFLGNATKPRADAIFTIRAADVASVKFENEVLVKDTDYTYDATNKIITVKKNDVIDFNSLQLTPDANCKTDALTGNGAAFDYNFEITTTSGVVSKVPVYVRQATRIHWDTGADKIKELMFLDARMQQFNIGSLSTQKLSNGKTYVFVERVGGGPANGYVNFNSELLAAQFDLYAGTADPMMNYHFAVDGPSTGRVAYSYVNGIVDGALSSKGASEVAIKTDKTWKFDPQYLPYYVFGDQINTADHNLGFIFAMGKASEGMTHFGVSYNNFSH